MLAHAPVYAFIMSAEYYDVTEQRQTVGHGLVERLAIGRSKNHLIVVPLLFSKRKYRHQWAGSAITIPASPPNG